MADTPLEESPDNQTNQIQHALIPDNTFTIILKANGKVYALGGEIGNIEPDTHDEDLDATLRAINGAGLTLQRTLAIKVAVRPIDYPLPGEQAGIEQDLTPKVEESEMATLYIAGADIKKGQPLHLQIDGKVLPLSPGKPDEPKAVA